MQQCTATMKAASIRAGLLVSKDKRRRGDEAFHSSGCSSCNNTLLMLAFKSCSSCPCVCMRLILYECSQQTQGRCDASTAQCRAVLSRAVPTFCVRCCTLGVCSTCMQAQDPPILPSPPPSPVPSPFPFPPACSSASVQSARECMICREFSLFPKPGPTSEL